VITAGAGFTALEYVLLRISREEEEGITRDFFHSFKENFKQGTVMGILYFGVAFFLLYDFYFLKNQETGMNGIMMVATLAVGLLLVLNMTWGFVLLSRYKNSAMQTIKYAFSFCIVHIGPTIVMLAVVLIPALIATISVNILPYCMIFGPIISGYIRPKLYGRVFEQVETANQENTEVESV
jgi:uncharacterized membrane protein YesL